MEYIGKEFVVRDNSYILNLSTSQPEDGSKHNVNLYNKVVDIISEPYEQYIDGNRKVFFNINHDNQIYRVLASGYVLNDNFITNEELV